MILRITLWLGILSPGLAAQSPLLPATALVDQAVENGQIPGAVLCVGQGATSPRLESVVHASGALAVVPEVEPMEADALFDLASLTKPVATATAVMIPGSTPPVHKGAGMLEGKRLPQINTP